MLNDLTVLASIRNAILAIFEFIARQYPTENRVYGKNTEVSEKNYCFL